ncbi:Uncharacterised protein [Collinsella intestinalis]|nr:Uncharacterised protein [Collinsella intestinalis]
MNLPAEVEMTMAMENAAYTSEMQIEMRFMPASSGM